MEATAIISWIQFAVFCLQVLVEYGTKLFSLIREKYWSTEANALEIAVNTGTTVSSEEKTAMFQRAARRVIVAQKGVEPTQKYLDKITRDAWRRENGPGAEPVNQPARKLDRVEIAMAKRELYTARKMVAMYHEQNKALV